MIKIGKKFIGDGAPTFIIAEMSGNHKKDINLAYKIIEDAKYAGADAIKLQTYTPDTITLNSNSPLFQTTKGLWENRTLYDLYNEAFTPWEWHSDLQKYAISLGLEFFSSPFDISSADFLEKLDVPCYKIASFEMNDIRLIKYVAQKGKPMIMSTGISELEEIQEAVAACKSVGNNKIILLKCTSAYPAPIDEANLALIPDMMSRFGLVVGLSDHTLGSLLPVAAVAMGAKVIEKHLTLDKNNEAVDSKFSMDKNEFKEMVGNIRNVEKAIGKADYSLTEKQKENLRYKRSLFSCKDIKKGEKFTNENIKSVRPSNGLNTKYYDDIVGKKATKDIDFATPISWDMVEK